MAVCVRKNTSMNKNHAWKYINLIEAEKNTQ